jgi:hypothetical protein
VPALSFASRGAPLGFKKTLKLIDFFVGEYVLFVWESGADGAAAVAEKVVP